MKKRKGGYSRSCEAIAMSVRNTLHCIDLSFPEVSTVVVLFNVLSIYLVLYIVSWLLQLITIIYSWKSGKVGEVVQSSAGNQEAFTNWCTTAPGAAALPFSQAVAAGCWT